MFKARRPPGLPPRRMSGKTNSKKENMSKYVSMVSHHTYSKFHSRCSPNIETYFPAGRDCKILKVQHNICPDHLPHTVWRFVKIPTDPLKSDSGLKSGKIFICMRVADFESRDWVASGVGLGDGSSIRLTSQVTGIRLISENTQLPHNKVKYDLPAGVPQNKTSTHNKEQYQEK